MTKEVEQEQQDENRLIAQRRGKLAEIRQQGNAFPNDFRRNVMNAELAVEYENTDADTLKADTRRVKIAGRMMTKRVMGKASFATIRDMSGDRTLVRFGTGDEITVQAGPEGVRFLLISGAPIDEPVAWHGPIVMNTQAELEQAFRELRNGTFIQPAL